MGTVIDGEVLKGAVLSESHASYKATVPYMFLGVGITAMAVIALLALVALRKKLSKNCDRAALRKGYRELLCHLFLDNFLRIVVHLTLLGNLHFYPYLHKLNFNCFCCFLTDFLPGS